ncbi:DUF1684 domain-containing protein [Cellulomonas sp.]|uniref:DUF1684 domain-containing protein n=1 Tax=Cellulomonas sp. TaxID=40001 RepID=UPI002D6D1146|nr:DUF1684 domain-containing protein [Cellulomonas sp.]HYQ75473.1 DUF1684 domain-containing protein [Cellulomonas sp.]
MSSTTPTSGSTAPAAWRAWAAARDAELADPHGWLSLTALHWLTAAPTAYDDLPGRWWADAAGIHVDPGAGPAGALTLDGAPLTGPTSVWTAADGAAGDLRAGDRRLEPVGRGPLHHGVRVRDPQAPAVAAFDGVPRFDHDPAWVLAAAFEPAAAGTVEETGSVAGRVRHRRDVAGHVRFTHDGAEHVLQVAGGAQPAIWFRDASNGGETAAFRVLAVHPRPDGTVVLDLNRAENAPCAFSDHGTCPLPPAGNTLPFAVRAGERRPAGR